MTLSATITTPSEARPASGERADALANDPVAKAAYACCARTTRERARNFFYGLRLTPEPRRSAIYSIYTWMRAADDLADEPGPIEHRREALGRFRERTMLALHGDAAGSGANPSTTAQSAGQIQLARSSSSMDEWWPAFVATVRTYPLDPTIFTHMLDGLDEDLDNPGFATEEDLFRYCYRVAGTAGLACLWIWGLRAGADASAARELALRRGQAFQRTNILRDLAQDLDESPRRMYVPAAALAKHQVSADELRAWADHPRCAALVREQAAIARSHYSASKDLESMIDPECAPTLWAMTKIYSGILDLIEADPSRVCGERRIRLPGAKKASIALGAALWAKVGRW